MDTTYTCHYIRKGQYKSFDFKAVCNSDALNVAEEETVRFKADNYFVEKVTKEVIGKKVLNENSFNLQEISTIVKMSNSEKILLLELFLIDIRISPAPNRLKRAQMASILAEDLGYFNHVERITDFINRGIMDGKYFKVGTGIGGYMGLDKRHSLPYTLDGKSSDFRSIVTEHLNCPNTLLDVLSQ